MNRILSVLTLSVIAVFLYAQPVPQNWMLMDQSSNYMGVSADKTYKELLQDRKGREVVVAVIDSERNNLKIDD